MSGTVKVRATINTLGLRPGQEAEIEITPKVVSLLRAGILLGLAPKEEPVAEPRKDEPLKLDDEEDEPVKSPRVNKLSDPKE